MSSTLPVVLVLLSKRQHLTELEEGCLFLQHIFGTFSFQSSSAKIEIKKIARIERITFDRAIDALAASCTSDHWSTADHSGFGTGSRMLY
jgi:hypothetical protein